LIPAFGQKSSYGNKKMGKIIIESAMIEQDSVLATNPILYEDVVDIENGKAELENDLGKSKVKFFTKSKKGIVQVKFEHLSEGINPILKFYNMEGKIVSHIWTDKKANTVGLRSVPLGTYLLVAEINGERFSWEIVKE
jgi:hypothetical protein